MVAMVGHGGFALSPGHGGNGRQWWVFLWVLFFFFLELACDCDGGCYGWWCWSILMSIVVSC